MFFRGKLNYIKRAFTLVELLVSISIIAMLLAVIMPVLSSARQSAHTVVCAANIKSSGLALLAYSVDWSYYPPAYTYTGSSDILNQLSKPVKGFSHWSGLLINGHYITADSSKCPAISKGGLPPVNTEKENLENGQKCMVEGVIDNQAERCAFTVNEALCARNRFVKGFEGALKLSRLVKGDVVTQSGNTIFVTEFVADWRIVSDVGNGLSKSYMPVHGFKGIGKMWPDRYDLNMVDDTAARSCGASGAYVRVTSDDVSTAPNINRSYPSRLDWVGRNHGSRINRKSNFFYVDGHIETKTIYKTIWNYDFEWGHSVYSITGNNGVNQF